MVSCATHAAWHDECDPLKRATTQDEDTGLCTLLMHMALNETGLRLLMVRNGVAKQRQRKRMAESGHDEWMPAMHACQSRFAGHDVSDRQIDSRGSGGSGQAALVSGMRHSVKAIDLLGHI